MFFRDDLLKIFFFILMHFLFIKNFCANALVHNKYERHFFHECNQSDLRHYADTKSGAYFIEYQVSANCRGYEESEKFHLKMLYSSLNQNDIYELGVGWMWRLSSFDKHTQMLYLSNGESVKINNSYPHDSSVFYYKKNYIKVYKNYIVIQHIDGSQEKVSRHSGKVFSLKTPQGYKYGFEFENNTRLISVYQLKTPYKKEKLKKIEILYLSRNTIHIKSISSRNRQFLTIFFKRNRFVSITNSCGKMTSFEYQTPLSLLSSTNPLISKIKCPMSADLNIFYTYSKDNKCIPQVDKITKRTFCNAPQWKEKVIWKKL